MSFAGASNPAPPIAPSSASNWARWALPAGICVATYALLFAIIPYCQGYFGRRLTLFEMVYALSTGYEDWNYCLLVPFLSLGIVWTQRHQLRNTRIQGSSWGLPITIFSLALYWLGYVVDHHYIGFVSAQLLIAGLIIWFFGLEMMKVLFFPWAFLIFAWPFLFLDSVIAFPLRMMLSDLAFHFLNGIGIQSIKLGSAVVSAPDPTFHVAAAKRFAIDVADPCSGIRSLFALTMVSALYAHFAVRGFWHKIIIIAAAIPFAILGNFVRILLLVFGTIIFGADFAIGTTEHPSLYHLAAGFFVFVVALGAMLILGTLLPLDWRNFGAATRQAIRSGNPAAFRRASAESVRDLY